MGEADPKLRVQRTLGDLLHAVVKLIENKHQIHPLATIAKTGVES
jgi:hypothetical protein